MATRYRAEMRDTTTRFCATLNHTDSEHGHPFDVCRSSFFLQSCQIVNICETQPELWCFRPIWFSFASHRKRITKTTACARTIIFLLVISIYSWLAKPYVASNVFECSVDGERRKQKSGTFNIFSVVKSKMYGIFSPNKMCTQLGWSKLSVTLCRLLERIIYVIGVNGNSSDLDRVKWATRCGNQKLINTSKPTRKYWLHENRSDRIVRAAHRLRSDCDAQIFAVAKRMLTIRFSSISSFDQVINFIIPYA